MTLGWPGGTATLHLGTRLGVEGQVARRGVGAGVYDERLAVGLGGLVVVWE